MARTEQEEFWEGQFGDSYSSRNSGQRLFASNLKMFGEILGNASSFPETVLEIGANIGLNFLALKALIPGVKFTGVEINPFACAELAKLGATAINASIRDFESEECFDMTLSKGVLIHLNPEHLQDAYQKLYRFSSRYILVAEYYNPSPVTVEYRGHSDRLFKRDFAGEMLELFPDLQVVKYGFAYHRGPFPQDDLTWFLMEKRAINAEM